MHLPHWPKIKGSRDIDLGLTRVLALLERLGNPHRKLPPTIHVAGTNGKGSTIAYMAAMLKDAGYKIHKYTSPHLVKFNERIILANEPIADNYLNSIIEECEKAANIKPKIDVTFFEGITVAAFLAFSRSKADVLLLETGMGGRLDATNVIENPIATIITSISYDHTEFLGKTLRDIAFEKAGIIKNNAPIIVSSNSKEALEVIEEKARVFKNAPIFFLKKHFDFEPINNKEKFKLRIGDEYLELPNPALKGSHQLENASLAITALHVQNKLKIKENNIKNGLKKVVWRGRIEKINHGKIHKLIPKHYEIYIDGSHNPEGSKALASWVSKENVKYINQGLTKPRTYIICSMLKNKDINGFFKYMSGVADFVVAVPMDFEPRVEQTSKIAKSAINNGLKATYSEDFEQAIKYIRTIHDNEKDQNFISKIIGKKSNKNPARILVCGSLHLVGEFIRENG